ncbi:MAG: Gfo/Idh/MocA family oxidoreductase [Nanoarchaeota archaeon]
MSSIISPQNPTEVLLIGGGFMANAHREAINQSGLLRIVGGTFSSDPKKSHKIAEKFGVKGYGTVGEMFDAERKKKVPQIVAILSPNSEHYLHFIQAVAAYANPQIPLGIQCEKPLCTDLKRAKHICDVVEDQQIPFVLTHSYSRLSMMVQAGDLVAKGVLGDLIDWNENYIQGWMLPEDMAVWRLNSEKAGPSCVLGDLGTHARYVLEQMIPNGKLKSVSALLRRIHGRELENYATVQGLLEMPNKELIPGTITVSNVSAGYPNGLSFAIRGTKGSLEYGLKDPEKLLLLRDTGPNMEYVRDPNRKFEVRSPGEVPDTHFYREIDGKRYASMLSPAAIEAEWLPGEHPGGNYLRSKSNLYLGLLQMLDAKVQGKPIPQLGLPNHQSGRRGVAFVEAALKSDKLRLRNRNAYVLVQE